MGVRGKGYTDSITFSMLHQSVLKFTHAPIRNFNIPPGSPGAFTLLNTGLKWKNKALHGQYPRILEKPHKDTVITNIWLSSNRKGETEELLAADKDQSINTRNYQKVICGQQLESKCRICSQHEETVDHIVSGCKV